MKKAAITLSALMVLASCTHSTTDIVAPKLEIVETKEGKNIGGTVVYNPHGLEQLVNARRDSALTRIRTVCSPGGYKIVKEETAAPAERDATYEGNPSLITGSTLRFIDFACVSL